MPVGTVPKGLYWDTEDPYHYIRTTLIDGDAEHELLVIGGEDHRTGQKEHPEESFASLEQWSRQMFPVISDFTYRWSGQIMETIDGLAFIGHDPGHGKNVFVATGDSGMGMTHGTIAGMLISDLIVGNENPWTELYNPSRKPVAAALEYIAENANTGWQYTDYLRPADIKSSADIPCGEGAVIRNGAEIIAVYQDQCGKTIQCGAKCPHLGGIVRWNSVEKSWDCPAHGSRFTATGKVINGPANSNLRPLPEGTGADQEIKTTELPPMPPGDSGIEPPATP